MRNSAHCPAPFPRPAALNLRRKTDNRMRSHAYFDCSLANFRMHENWWKAALNVEEKLIIPKPNGFMGASVFHFENNEEAETFRNRSVSAGNSREEANGQKFRSRQSHKTTLQGYFGAELSSVCARVFRPWLIGLA